MIFSSYAKKKKAALYIGAPEAEAESLPNSKVSLQDVYEDYHELFNELGNEKFIIVGRKGSGKSAFAEYVSLLSNKDPNLFCAFIRQDVVSLEELVQVTASTEKASKEHLFKWLIYTNIISLFFHNEAAREAKGYKLLLEFLKKNSGFINIDKGEILELVKKHSFEVSIEQFKRFFKGKFHKDIEIKESRAAFYKLLPHLEEVVLEVLNSRINKDNKNGYIIFFDDLDINFKSDNPESVDTLLHLLRSAKQINNSVFAKSEVNAKVVILIRDDVERMLSSKGADIAKIFSSYATHLNWYQEEYLQPIREDELGIKKLIVKRIDNAFKEANIKKIKDDAWDSLISDDFSPKTSFKYVADHTFFRPRDFILLFKPLESGQYEFPLNKYETNKLIGQYASEVVKELSNELSSFYSTMQIHNIFDSLKEINRIYNCSYIEGKRIVNRNCLGIDADVLLEDLFDRSIIGCINDKNNFVRFKYKVSRKDAHDYVIDKDLCLIVHAGIKIYLATR